jgi:hypothetical protein
MFHACALASLTLGILDNIQHHFMAISTLDASLPALHPYHLRSYCISGSIIYT